MIKTVKKILSLLSRSERRNLKILTVFMIFNALVEVLGIASIAPLIAIIVSPESIETFPILVKVYKQFEFENYHNFSMCLGVLIFCIILFNNSVMLATHYLSFRFTNNREYSIGWSLLRTYIYQPYSFFLKSNSADLLHNIHIETSFVVAHIIMGTLNLMARGISAFMIIVFIFFVNPAVSLVIGIVLGLAYLAVYLSVKNKLFNLGKKRLELTNEKLRLVTDTIKIAKDIKMLNAEPVFLDKYKEASRNYAKISTFADIVAVSPRYIIEVIAVSALVFTAIYLVFGSEDPNSTLPILGIYAFAGYRLLPALQQIFNALAKIQFSSHSLDIVTGELETYHDKALENMNQDVSTVPYHKDLAFKDVGFFYQNSEKILHDINFNVKKGEKIGIIGSSGAGKSTLIDLLVGLSEPTEGGLYIDGKLLDPSDYAGWRQNVSYVSQNVYLLDDTVDMNISLTQKPEDVDQQRLQKAKEQALVDQFLAEMKEDSSLIVGENGIRLSGGQRQRIGIARALYHDKEVLVLDEATSALDRHTEENILENITKTTEKTLILITHRVETLRVCDEIYILSEGEIVDSGPYEELQKTSKEFKKLSKSSKT